MIREFMLEQSVMPEKIQMPDGSTIAIPDKYRRV
jgi:hypothetical protein